MNNYILSMSGYITRAQGYGQDGFEFVVSVLFDAKQFNAFKKKSDPLAAGIAQIKNVVFDAAGIRSVPGYAPISYGQRYPRASKGQISLKLTFEVPPSVLAALNVDTREWRIHHPVDLQSTLELTRNDGHLFAKTALASALGH